MCNIVIYIYIILYIYIYIYIHMLRHTPPAELLSETGRRPHLISSGRVFIMNTTLHRELEPFRQKRGERLQRPGEESCA